MKNATIAVILFLLVFAALAEKFGGYVLLEGETNHSGTKVMLEESDIPYTGLAYTDSTGKFIITDAPIFTFMGLTISHPGFETVSYDLFMFIREDSTDTFEILVKNSADILGTVTLDGETNHSGSIVTELGSGISDTTDSSGAYALTYVPKGTIRIAAVHEGFIPDTTDYISFDYDTSGIDFHLFYDGIGESKPSLPGEVTLYGNIPNPFNTTTEIVFEITMPADVELAVFDMTGHKVTTLINGNLNSGLHSIIWDGNDAESGIYLCKLTANGYSFAHKMLFVK